jgi:hypothetical protein
VVKVCLFALFGKLVRGFMAQLLLFSFLLQQVYSAKVVSFIIKIIPLCITFCVLTVMIMIACNC